MKILNISIGVLGLFLLAISTNTIAGGKASEAYFVKVDSETTTENAADDPKKVKAAEKEKAAGLPTGKRQHKPFVLSKPIDKASPMAQSKAKRIPGQHKVGDITLKRGVINSGTTDRPVITGQVPNPNN